MTAQNDSRSRALQGQSPDAPPKINATAADFGKTFLTPRQVADILAVNISTVIGWIHRQELRGVLVSVNPLSNKPRYRVSPADLETFIAARTVHAPPPRRRRVTYKRIV